MSNQQQQQEVFENAQRHNAAISAAARELWAAVAAAERDGFDVEVVQATELTKGSPTRVRKRQTTNIFAAIIWHWGNM